MSGVRRHIPLLAGIGVYLLLYAAASWRFDHFFSLQVFVNFFTDNAALGIVAVGMTFVILSGGIDLSVGSVVALSATIIAVLIEEYEWAPMSAMAVALLVGAIFGMLMGGIIHYLDLAPFIVTLAGMFMARGLALIIHLEPVAIHDSALKRIAAIALPLIDGTALPVTAIVFVAALIVGTYLAVLTPVGRAVYAIGGDSEAARLMGVRVGRTRLFVYSLSGVCASLAGAVLTLYQLSGDPSAGVSMELDAIAAVVIGGTALTGGVGGVPGTLIGVLILGTIQTAIMFEGTLSSWWTRVAIGLLLLAFILLQRLLSASVRSER